MSLEFAIKSILLSSFVSSPVGIRLTLYIDQAIIRASNEGTSHRDGIENTVSAMNT